MRTLRTSEAAAYLNVSPNTLRAWEQRFGFPIPGRSPGRHRIYSFAELNALRDALSDGLAVSSAVSAARDTTAADEHTLTVALLNFDYVGADRAMALRVSMCTFESAVTDVLVPALELIEERMGPRTAPWAFASRWADEWLARAERVASTPPDGRPRVLFGDCFGGRSDVDALHAHVLEVLSVRGGVTALRLPVDACLALERVTRVFAPEILVLTGWGARDKDVANFEHIVSRTKPLARMHYRGKQTAAGTRALSSSPLRARDQLLAQLRAAGKGCGTGDASSHGRR